MFNVCPACGAYSDDKEIDPAGPCAICRMCGHAHRFVRLPLFVITGASGVGKTTVCLHLAQRTRECIFMESDILWMPAFNQPEDDYRVYRNMWLRVAKNIHQAGRSVVLCGSATPQQFEACVERRYLADIHYLALVCDEGEMVQRLEARPSWRGSASAEFIERMVAFNGWLRDHAASTAPPMTLLDTTDLSIAAAAEQALDWIRARLVEPG